MKVLFLDIDGVLNEGTHRLRWLPERMESLKSVLDETEAKVVIHSGWRTFLSHDSLQWIFQSHGIDSERVIDVTPGMKHCEAGRCESIYQWLRVDGRKVTSWVVVDDLYLGDLPAHRFIQSRPETGPDWSEVKRKLEGAMA